MQTDGDNRKRFATHRTEGFLLRGLDPEVLFRQPHPIIQEILEGLGLPPERSLVLDESLGDGMGFVLLDRIHERLWKTEIATVIRQDLHHRVQEGLTDSFAAERFSIVDIVLVRRNSFPESLDESLGKSGQGNQTRIDQDKRTRDPESDTIHSPLDVSLASAARPLPVSMQTDPNATGQTLSRCPDPRR